MKLHHLVLILPIFTALPAHGQQTGKKTTPGTPEVSKENSHNEATEYLYAPFSIIGQQWLPDKGMVLMGPGKLRSEKDLKFKSDDGHYDTRRALPYALDNGPCVTLKVQKDYKVTDENASPALFTWTKDAGASGVWNVDAAVRVDLWIPGMYDPDKMEASLAFGYEIRRDESPANMVDLQSYHISIPFVDKKIFGRIPFLQTSDQVYQLDVSYNRDGISGKDGFDFETDYRPTFKLPFGKYGLWMGTRCNLTKAEGPLDPGTLPEGFYYLLEPKIGLSYGDRYSLGSPTANLDDELVASYQFKALLGKRLGRSASAMVAEISYTFKGGNSLTGGDSFSYHEAGLHLKPASPSNPVSFDVTYTKGASGFTQPEIDRLMIGFGVQF